jgi:hypothetical protein
MAITYKILGQDAPIATTEVDLYTVPAATQTVASSVTITNRGSTVATFRVAVVQGGGVTGPRHYLYYELPLAGYDTFIATIGVTMETSDVVRVYASSANLTFQLFGSEIT